eukprot:13333197-Alexandrium_andersonii.AAC.1
MHGNVQLLAQGEEHCACNARLAPVPQLQGSVFGLLRVRVVRVLRLIELPVRNIQAPLDAPLRQPAAGQQRVQLMGHAGVVRVVVGFRADAVETEVPRLSEAQRSVQRGVHVRGPVRQDADALAVEGDFALRVQLVDFVMVPVQDALALEEGLLGDVFVGAPPQLRQLLRLWHERGQSDLAQARLVARGGQPIAGALVRGTVAVQEDRRDREMNGVIVPGLRVEQPASLGEAPLAPHVVPRPRGGAAPVRKLDQLAAPVPRGPLGVVEVLTGGWLSPLLEDIPPGGRQAPLDINESAE